MNTADWIGIGLALVKGGVVVGILLGLVAYSVVAERRFSAWIQDRIGPNRVGIPLTNIRLAGLGQPIADGLKFLLKEELIPGSVNKFYYVLAPMLAMIPAILTVSAVPFGSVIDLKPVGEFLGGLFHWPQDAIDVFRTPAVIADLSVGILFVFAIVSISVYGVVLAGWASNSKYPFLGGIRSSAQMISYEISMGLAVVPVFLLVGQLNLGEIVRYQAAHGWLAFPILPNPASLKAWVLWLPFFVSFLIFLISAFAETNRLPFDLAECETELVGGYHTEYGGMKFALFFLGEYAAMIVVSSMIVTLFLGGWSLPLPWFNGLPIPEGFWIKAWAGAGVPGWFWPVHILVFLGKMAFFMFLFIWVRWSLPRFRYDQLMGLGWKFFIPIALANVMLTALLLALMG